MSSNLALGVVIGGAVGSSFGRAITDSGSKIDAFKKKAETARGFQGLIGDTIRMQREMSLMGDKSSSAYTKLYQSQAKNLDALKKNGLAVNNLQQQYDRLGRTARGLDLGAAGRARIGDGIDQMKSGARTGAVVGAAVAVPTKVAADYQAILRDIAIKGGFARTGQERAMGETIRTTASDTGLGRNELAQAVNALVSGGMDVKEALSYAPLIAKFAVGQGSSGEETAKMVSALSQNAKITDPAQMQQAMESIAFLGKAGSFESVDMARWFPELLAEMQKNGIVGQESVTSLGSMLQVMMKTSGSPEQAANNLKNWLSKIGSDQTKKSYENAGIDYEAQMQEAIGKGWNTLEASMVLAKAYIEKTDPEQAKSIAAAGSKISAEKDPEQQKRMLAAFAESMKTGDLFTDMQVKAALTAYMQNSNLYAKMKKESAGVTGDIEKDLADRRASSKQKWSEMGAAMNESLARIGDAIQPLTDIAATALTSVANAVSKLATDAPTLVTGLVGIGATMATLSAAKGAWNIGRGALDVLRGGVMTRTSGNLPGLGGVVARVVGKIPLINKTPFLGKALEKAGALGGAVGAATASPVFVTNWPDGGGTSGSAGSSNGKSGLLGRLGSAAESVMGAGEAVAGAGTSVAANDDLIGTGQAVMEAGQAVVEGGKDALEVGKEALGVGKSVLAAGKAALGATSMGALAGGGAGTMAAAAGGVLAAGAAGYAIGSLLNVGINKALSAATGSETSLGSWIYDKLHGDPGAAQPAAAKPAVQNALLGRTQMSPAVAAPSSLLAAPIAKPATAAPVLQQSAVFSPTLTVTVQGDVKDPRQVAADLMPHLKRMFADFQAQQSRSGLYDAAHI
ncbi:MAG: phage tail tape measure protein [Burkholderiaceae bacterium]